MPPQAAHHIAVFASGNGSNARAIIEYFKEHETVQLALIVSNKPDAGVLSIAEEYLIPSMVVNKTAFQRPDFADTLKEQGITFIALAGFLWLVPPALIQAFPNRMVNIHPSLLPKFGGKGMYGHKVHKAVLAAGEQETGISIHYVNEQFDEGKVIAQYHCPVHKDDTTEQLQKRVQQLEHRYFPGVIDHLLTGAPLPQQ